MDDASLEEFLDAGDRRAGRERSDPESSVQRETTESAVPTARWSPAGDECDRCGSERERLWTDGGRAVCRSCKEW